MASLETELPPAAGEMLHDPRHRAGQVIRRIGLPFLASRIAVWGVLVYAFLSIPLGLRTAPEEDVPAYTHDLGWLVDVWGRWDSVHFLAIAEHGYDAPGGVVSAAFYPLYPAIVSAVRLPLLGHTLLAAVLVSLAAAVAAACLLHKLAEDRLGTTVAQHSVLFLATFPFALFLQAVYSESVFLLLALATFVAAERKHMTLAAVFAGLGMLTRPTGFALLAALLVFAWLGGHRARDVGRLAIAPALFLAYPLILWVQTGEPFSFMHAERYWGRSVSLLGPADGLWEGLRAAWFGARQLVSGSTEHPFWTSVDPDRVALMNLENMAYVIVFTALALVAWKKLGMAYGVYALGCIAMALSAPSSTYPYPLLSFPRFALVIFPAFIALGIVVRRPWAVATVAGVGTLLLGVNLLRWAGWQFIG
jgi:hypothetical protein